MSLGVGCSLEDLLRQGDARPASAPATPTHPAPAGGGGRGAGRRGFAENIGILDLFYVIYSNLHFTSLQSKNVN